MEYDKIIRVCVDGIYFYSHLMYVTETFAPKDKMTLQNKECNRDLSGIFKTMDQDNFVKWNQVAEFYPNFDKQLLLGAGELARPTAP